VLKVINGVAHTNVNVRRTTRLLLREYNRLGMSPATQANSASYPPRDLKCVPAKEHWSLAVKATVLV